MKREAEKLENIAVVLVQPKGAGNVGAIARSMAHFGLGDLRVVAPRCDMKSLEARSMAMSAQPLLAGAAHYATLRDALEDCSWAVATSRRLGRHRRPTTSPREGAARLLQRAGAGKIALVFGREDSGLRTDEIDFCQERLLIPVIAESDSLNLSQAALIIFWELFQEKQAGPALEPARIFQADRLAPRDKIEGLVDHLVATLEMIGFIPHHQPERVARSFRQLIDRIRPSEKEVRMMRGVLRQAAWKIFHPGTSGSAEASPAVEEMPAEESPALETKRKERLIRNA
jgi:tRNA/rRNA methyltransferase